MFIPFSQALEKAPLHPDDKFQTVMGAFLSECQPAVRDIELIETEMNLKFDDVCKFYGRHDLSKPFSSEPH